MTHPNKIRVFEPIIGLALFVVAAIYLCKRLQHRQLVLVSGQHG